MAGGGEASLSALHWRLDSASYGWQLPAPAELDQLGPAVLLLIFKPPGWQSTRQLGIVLRPQFDQGQLNGKNGRRV
jgi:hypothetical protein